MRNHDELTLDKLSEEERQEVFAAFGPDQELQLYGRGLRRRLPTMLGGDERRIRMVYSLAFSLPGTPVLFYGEEIGMAENLCHRGALQRPGADAVVRRAAGGLHHGPRTLPSGRGGWAFRLSRGQCGRQRRDPDSLLNWMERLIRRRRECPELGWGEWALLDPGDAAIFAQRSDWQGSTVVAVHNLSGQDRRASLDLGEDGTLVDLFHDRDHALQAGEVTLELAPYGAHWFRLRRPGERLPP